MPGGRTAILFFSHRPAREWQNKRFVRGDYGKHRRVATALYKHSWAAVGESGLPVLEVNRAQQRGRTFGARLANAFADAFAEGYEHVIAVGSDCPRLAEVGWEAVEARLEAGSPVLGPTTEGAGAYLIGLSRAQFDRDAFAGLPWQTADLLPALTRYCTAQADGAPIQLTPRADVNGHDDLLALVRNETPVPRALYHQLRRVLGPLHHQSETRALQSTSRTQSPPVRGPPSGLKLRRSHRIAGRRR